MKQSRLLEIIREEIASALNEQEQLDEIPDFGGRYDQQVAAKYGEEDTLQKAVDEIVDRVLRDRGLTKAEAVKLEKEDLKSLLKDIRTQVSGKNQDVRVKHALEKQQEFDDSGSKLQDNQTNNAILKSLGAITPSARGRKADPNKPEKAPSTGKRGRPAGPSNAGKAVTLTPGDDGFDTVTYNEPEEDEALAAVGSDETAKELGQMASVSKDENFDRIDAGLQNKVKRSKGELSPEDMKTAIAIINKAKDTYGFNKVQVDKLRATIGL